MSAKPPETILRVEAPAAATLPSPAAQDRVQRLLAALQARGFSAEYVADPAAARDAVLARLPAGAEVMTGGSTTLEQLGLPAALREAGHRLVKDELQKEPDKTRRHRLRRLSTTADWVLGSVNALTEDGILVAVDGSGNRVGAYAFGAGKVILVVSTNKVTPTLEAAFARVRDHVLPRESERIRALGWGAGSSTNKWLLWEREAEPGRVHVVLVGEPLGF